MQDLSRLSLIVDYYDVVIWLRNGLLAFGRDQIYTWHGVSVCIEFHEENLSSSALSYFKYEYNGLRLQVYGAT